MTGKMTNFRAEDMPGAQKIAFTEGTRPSADKRSETNPAVDPEAVPEGTTKEISEWVGDDSERAYKALEIETKAETPRKTLVEDLERVIRQQEEADAQEKAAAEAQEKADADAAAAAQGDAQNA